MQHHYKKSGVSDLGFIALSDRTKARAERGGSQSLPAIVIVAIDVQNLLPLDAENTREDTLGQACAQHNDIVLLGDLVHGGCRWREGDGTWKLGVGRGRRLVVGRGARSAGLRRGNKESEDRWSRKHRFLSSSNVVLERVETGQVIMGMNGQAGSECLGKADGGGTPWSAGRQGDGPRSGPF